MTGGCTVRVARDDELEAAGEVIAEAYRAMPGMDADHWYLGGVAIATDPRWTDSQRVYERVGFRRAPERDFAPVPGVFLWAYVLDL